MTEIVIIAAAVLLIAYDLFAVIRGGVKNTISWVLYTAAKAYPIIPFAFGILFGHLFWSQVS